MDVNGNVADSKSIRFSKSYRFFKTKSKAELTGVIQALLFLL